MKELLQSKDIYEEHKKAIKIKDDAVAKQFEYVHQHASYPYYENTAVHYFSSGEEYFNDLLDKLKKAQNFIFLEFFIVKDGMMLQQILDVLKERVQAGVQVYFMYDDGGSITCLPKDFNKTLDQCGIHNVVFNPVSLWLIFLSKYNNRDHRKICVIDNEYGYMGGLNIADEYINKIVRFGHWKDSAVRLQGEGVASLTTMFIQFYNVCAPYKKLDYRNFLLPIDPVEAKGIVLPFSDSPTDDEDVSHTVHLNMIARAERYVYIHTPYLILDEQLIGVLQSAAKSGVEVIITVPKIPDKKTVFMVTRSNYEALLKAGVRIFEYTPGFIHSKLFISDDRIALCGTINMDYRSYFLHYECGTLIAYDDEIMKMKEDYLNTLKVSQEITLEDVYARPFIVRVIQAVLAIFAPLF